MADIQAQIEELEAKIARLKALKTGKAAQIVNVADVYNPEDRSCFFLPKGAYYIRVFVPQGKNSTDEGEFDIRVDWPTADQIFIVEEI